MIRALANLEIKRPSGAFIPLAELVSATLEYSPELIQSVIVSGYTTAHPSILGWTVSADTIADDAGLAAAVAAVKGGERLNLELTLGDGYILTGEAYISNLGRGGSAVSRFETSLSFLGVGPLTSTEIGVLEPSAGSFSMSGQDAELLAARLLTGEAGSFAMAGQDAELIPGVTLTAESGSFALSGQDTALSTGRSLAAEQGSFALTGQDAEFFTGEYSLVAEAGSFALTGQDAALERDRRLLAGQGNFTLTGQDAELVYAQNLVVQDTFTDTDETALSSHTPDVDTVGTGWSVNGLSYKVVSNRCVVRSSTNIRTAINTGVGDMHVKYSGRWDNTPGTTYLGIVGRANSGASTYWHGRYEGDGDVQLWETTTLRQSGNIGAPTQGQDYTIELVCDGTSLSFRVDSVERLSHTSSSLQAQTYAGIRFSDPVSIDNFEVSAP